MRTDNGGARRWAGTCQWCGKTYVHTNFMRLGPALPIKHNRNGQGYWALGPSGKSEWVDDTHQRACERRWFAAQEGA